MILLYIALILCLVGVLIGIVSIIGIIALYKSIKTKKIQNANQLNIYFKTIFKPMVSNLLTIGF